MNKQLSILSVYAFICFGDDNYGLRVSIIVNANTACLGGRG